MRERVRSERPAPKASEKWRSWTRMVAVGMEKGDWCLWMEWKGKAYYHTSGFYRQKGFIIILEVGKTGLIILCPNLTSCHLDMLNLRCIGLKKKKMHKLQVLLGVKWGLRLGDSVSDSSEKLLQRGSGGRSVYVILVKGEFNEMKHLS